MAGGDSSKERIRISVVHAVDGAWDTGDQAMTKAQLGEAISLGQALPQGTAAYRPAPRVVRLTRDDDQRAEEGL